MPTRNYVFYLIRMYSMLDNEFHIKPTANATLVSIVSPSLKGHASQVESEHSLQELKELLRTLNIKHTGTHIQTRKDISPATVIGKGKLLEITQDAKDHNSDLLVFDFELTASQVRNIKEATGLSVIDRCHVIWEIFAGHARTKEAKIQIEIARLEYILPRLSGFWTHFSRQKGGIGVRGGEGEQQIELDRRIVRERIEFLKRDLKTVLKTRKEQKKKRQNMAITAALVGYTNAGKSSVMNRLCKVSVLEEDKLFATLDSTFRTLNPDTRPPMILIDTVGLIQNLPAQLINGFKTTLESMLEADLLIIVCDISDPNYKKHLEVTQNILKDLDAGDKNQVIVFNKKDLLNDPLMSKVIQRSYPGSFVISSFDANDINHLRKHIIDYFLAKQVCYDLFIPYHDGSAHSIVNSKTNIINSKPHENGIFYQIRVPEFMYQMLSLQTYELAPKDSKG